ncbi:MAG: hypothetical protein KF861_19720, partial [Planctomycetaceae bacterium]|nr:hypothetical protein [Planctomycetaceae bacterium]
SVIPHAMANNDMRFLTRPETEQWLRPWLDSDRDRLILSREDNAVSPTATRLKRRRLEQRTDAVVRQSSIPKHLVESPRVIL